MCILEEHSKTSFSNFII